MALIETAVRFNGFDICNKATLPGICKDLASILTSLTPLFKERSKADKTYLEEIGKGLVVGKARIVITRQISNAAACSCPT